MEHDIVRIKERVEIAIEVGESHFREFKSALAGVNGQKKPRPAKDICRDIAEALVGFANADGGEIIIGVEDNSAITGVHHPENDIDAFLESPKTHVHPNTPLSNVQKSRVDYNGKLLLYFQTPKSAETIHLTSNGLCLQRRDRETVPIPPQQIMFERKERISREYDRQFVETATLADLDIDLISEVAETISKGLSPEKCLQHLNLAEYTNAGLKIKIGALLLFARDITKWHPRSQVRFLKVSGVELKSGSEYNAAEVGTIRGNILSLMADTWEKLRPFLVQTKLSSGAVFETRIMYPELACQEALINAIAHRDYSSEGRGIEVFIYDDRLEIKSPGMLLSTISILDIRKEKGVHESRNALVARVLRERGYMRELGEGMVRIYQLFRKNELAIPDLISEDDSFTIALHHKSVYTTEQRLWLDQFRDDNLNLDEKTVVLLGYGNNQFSADDIWNAVGIVDTEYYRKLVYSLQTKGILASTYENTRSMRAAAKKAKIPSRKFKRFYIIKPELRGQARSEIKRASDGITREVEYEEVRIYVTNIPYEIDEGDIYELFSEAGNVEDIYIAVNRETGHPRGFAFIGFENREQAEKAVAKFNGTFLGNRRIAVTFAYKHQN
ncbi:MAG: ATP-binding protein [Chloroflexota bacterium]